MSKTQLAPTAETSLARMPSHKKDVKELLQQMSPEFTQALPKIVSVERFMRVALTTINKNPKLLDCTQGSLLSCLLDCASLGLVPDNVLGQAYLIPFQDRKTGTTICTLVVGYKGLVTLALRSGMVKTIMAQAVYEGDVFEFQFGAPNAFIKHVPAFGERGKVLYFYSYVIMSGEGYAFDVMSVADVERIRARSKAPNSPAWTNDFPEMGKKTVLKRLTKYTPLSPELVEAVHKDNLWEAEPAKVIRPVFKDANGAVLVDDSDIMAKELLESGHNERADFDAQFDAKEVESEVNALFQ